MGKARTLAGTVSTGGPSSNGPPGDFQEFTANINTSAKKLLVMDDCDVTGGWLCLRGVVAAVGKEVWDAQGHGTPDHIDALVTILGGAAMLGWLSYIAPILT